MTDQVTPSDVWEQATPFGGADVDGQLPAVARPVVVVGTTQTRETPALNAQPGKQEIALNGVERVVGRMPQRSRITLIATSAGAAVVTVSTDRQQAANGFGLRLPLNVPVSLHYAGELYAAATTAAATVSYFSESHPG